VTVFYRAHLQQLAIVEHEGVVKRER